jgi:cytochrome c oxidase cbb3-type subunit 2
MNFNFKHEWIETNIGLMAVLTMLAISVGGLEQRGRDIFQREGCYLCHSQMIRPFRDEKLRYGHYSLAAESQYDHPFQWGSKRTGPDLARVGGKYSNEWHVQHLVAPRSMVPESVMPNYPWLLSALRKVGVPYSLTQEEYKANVAKFGETVAPLLHIPDAQKNLLEQANFGNYDGDRSGISEMDALVAYLQVLGTMVDFSKYNDDAFVNDR